MGDQDDRRCISAERFEDYVQAHGREHQLLAEQVQQARETIDFRLRGMNELREQINNERGLYFTRQAHEAFRDGVERRLNTIDSTLASMQSANVTWLVALGIFFTVVQVVLRLFVK